ncbi:energy transducer TonB [Sphingomonas sp. So64.6b]|uniref:energy transducer TonB n=1 Tax=Sphingomonas sp. So64.6b TaxID=2997354 RepID=UPI0015FEF280|nr:energy transducer TonB [Sphingomonas sp. So64.6b]QNA83335.1 energy transducer TonB [Sphingomonas sp. So64.6b]
MIELFYMVSLALAQSASPALDTPTGAVPRYDPGNWFPQDSYPKDARKNGDQGSVSIRLEIDETGKPTACTVTVSSGFASLDDHSCKTAMKNARFKAVVVDGVAVPSHTFIRNIVWRKP